MLINISLVTLLQYDIVPIISLTSPHHLPITFRGMIRSFQEHVYRAQPHPSCRDKCNFYFRYTAITLGLVDLFLAVSSHCSSVSRCVILHPYDRYLRSAVLYHPTDLFCLSYVHPESQHIR